MVGVFRREGGGGGQMSGWNKCRTRYCWMELFIFKCKILSRNLVWLICHFVAVILTMQIMASECSLYTKSKSNWIIWIKVLVWCITLPVQTAWSWRTLSFTLSYLPLFTIDQVSFLFWLAVWARPCGFDHFKLHFNDLKMHKNN